MKNGISYIDFEFLDGDKQWALLREQAEGGPKCVFDAPDCEHCPLVDSCPGPEGGSIAYRVVKVQPLERLLEMAKKHDA